VTDSRRDDTGTSREFVFASAFHSPVVHDPGERQADCLRLLWFSRVKLSCVHHAIRIVWQLDAAYLEDQPKSEAAAI
jgi:hypothetical protein